MSRYLQQAEPDAPLQRDGDTAFFALDSRTAPVNLPAGTVQVAENIRFEQRVALVRNGIQFQNSLISLITVPLVLPFVLPSVLGGDGFFASAVYTDPDNVEWLMLATTSAGYMYRPGVPSIKLDYPVNEFVSPTDQACIIQTMGYVYILRGEKDVTFNVTSITRAGAVATVTTSGDHGYFTGQWVTISGATQPEYNVTVQITVTGANTFEYPVAGAPATPATGTIIANRRKPALRWDGNTANDYILTNYGILSLPYIYMPASHFGIVQQNRTILQYTRNQAIVSEVLEPERYNSIYGVFNFAQGGPDYLIGFHPYQNDQTLVLNRRSLHLINGISGDVAVMSTQEITRQIGCISRKSVATCGADILFLSDNGVYRLRPGLELELRGTQEPLSAPIDNIIRTINFAAIQSASAVYHNNRYYLLVPTDGSTRNNKLLIFNFLNGAWESVDTFANFALFDEMQVISANGYDNLFLISADGGIFLHEAGGSYDFYNSALGTPTQTIPARLVTRDLQYGGYDLKRFNRVLIDATAFAGADVIVTAQTTNPDDTKQVAEIISPTQEDFTGRAIVGKRGASVNLAMASDTNPAELNGRWKLNGYYIEAYVQDAKTVSTN